MTIHKDHAHREKGDTWPKILKYNYETYGDRRRAMRHKHYGIWQPYTWKDYYLNVKYLSLGLLALGFEPEDKALIIGDNAPQWYYAELAVQANRGVAVGMFSESLPQEIKTIAENCDVSIAFAEGQEQVDKFLQIRDQLPQLKKIIFWNYKGLAHYDDEMLIGYREIIERGKAYAAENKGIFEQKIEAGQADDICVIVHTAGTTGSTPKAVMHSFRTLRAGAEQLLQLDPWTSEDNLVPYLPPVWINEQWLGIACHLLSAGVMNFAETAETQQRDSRETCPSIVCYRSRVWETQAAMIQARMLGADALKRFAFKRLMPIGYRAAEAHYQRRKPDLLAKALYHVADRFLFRPIKKSLGLTNARICYTTGGILSPEAFRFYHALNLPLKNIYATTEGGILTGAQNGQLDFATIGPPHKETRVKITDSGEISCRQAGAFLGYYKDPQATDDVLQDGWFASDDTGYFREDGHLVFVERTPNLITLRGKTIAPQLVESRLRFSPYIKDAWVLTGPADDYLSAVIVIHYENVSRWAGQRRLFFTSFVELSQLPEVYALVAQEIDRVNQSLAGDFRIKKFVNLNKEFDPDENELTRTRNLRRPFLRKRYHHLIEAIYNDAESALLNVQNAFRDGEMRSAGTKLRVESIEGADE
jgi:long-chain acyl-CoA synthetase